MRVLVCGGRDFANAILLRDTLNALLAKEGLSHVITGGAHGADELAERWARGRGVAFTVYPADWLMHGKVAGPLRNRRMLVEGKPDLVVAFPGGKGTADMVNRARQADIPIRAPGAS